MRQAKIKRFNTLDYTGTEAITTICTNLLSLAQPQKRQMTSSMQGAGKSYMCLNILCKMGQTRQTRAAFIDADPRQFAACACPVKVETDGRDAGIRAHYLAFATLCELEDRIYETGICVVAHVASWRMLRFFPTTSIDTPRLAEMLDDLLCKLPI
ncbi:MAG: hypothetical protein ACLVB5_16220 [Christensenellales bacterium]